MGGWRGGARAGGANNGGDGEREDNEAAVHGGDSVFKASSETSVSWRERLSVIIGVAG